MLTEREEYLCKAIEDAAVKVHQQLGPGLFDRTYETCFIYELNKMGISTESQKDLHASYKGKDLDLVLTVDVLVEDLIVCAIELEEEENPLWKAEVLTHLKFSGLHVGFVLNFNTVQMEEGMRKYCIE